MLEGLVISTGNYGLDAFCGRVEPVKLEVSLILCLIFGMFPRQKKSVYKVGKWEICWNDYWREIQNYKLDFDYLDLSSPKPLWRGRHNQWFFSCNFQKPIEMSLVKVILILMIGQSLDQEEEVHDLLPLDFHFSKPQIEKIERGDRGIEQSIFVKKTNEILPKGRNHSNQQCNYFVLHSKRDSDCSSLGHQRENWPKEWFFHLLGQFFQKEWTTTYFQIFLYYLLENGFLYFIMAVAKKKRIHHTKKGCRETWQGMIGAHTLRGDLETIDLEIWKSWENPFGHIYTFLHTMHVTFWVDDVAIFMGGFLVKKDDF